MLTRHSSRKRRHATWTSFASSQRIASVESLNSWLGLGLGLGLASSQRIASEESLNSWQNRCMRA